MTKPIFSPGQDFLESYANWKGLQSVCLTFDVDFAPDYMIREVLDRLAKWNVSATFFATHDSPLLQQIACEGVHELGLHPFVDARSTQGAGLKDILDRFAKSFPSARGNRFHVLQHSYRDLMELGRRGFEYDVSTLRLNCPYLLPAWHPDLKLTLLTYLWEDGPCENSGLPMELSSLQLDLPGMKIVNFHPMNIYINGSDAVPRLKFMKENPDLLNCPESTALLYRQTGKGAGSLIEELMRRLNGAGCRFLKVSELVRAFHDSLKLETKGACS